MTPRSFRPIPDGLVLLSFDDGNKSDLTTVAPVLINYGFGATFFITEGLGFLDPADSGCFLNWDDVRSLYELGFEIGNHTKSHPDVTALPVDQLAEEIVHIQHRCMEHGIPAPITFCYPGVRQNRDVVGAVADQQFVFARGGPLPVPSDGSKAARGRIYDPHTDCPLQIPGTGYSSPFWTLNDVVWAVDQARGGRIASLVYHGVPGLRHPWASTEPAVFAAHMRYLHDAGCRVISFRDLNDYVDPAWARTGHDSGAPPLFLDPAEL